MISGLPFLRRSALRESGTGIVMVVPQSRGGNVFLKEKEVGGQGRQGD